MGVAADRDITTLVQSLLMQCLVVFAAVAVAPRHASGQESGGSTAASVAGGALGLASGATLAAVGSLVPCSQSYAGPTCVRWSAIGGGTVGAVGGSMLGSGDSERLGDAAVGAGIGFAAGAVVGIVLKSTTERFGWQDVATVGLFGGSIGSVPLGSAVGLLGGSAVGLALWSLIDDFKSPDLFGAAVAGLALGGITEWLVRGIDARSGGSNEVTFTMPLRVGR